MYKRGSSKVLVDAPSTGDELDFNGQAPPGSQSNRLNSYSNRSHGSSESLNAVRSEVGEKKPQGLMVDSSVPAEKGEIPVFNESVLPIATSTKGRRASNGAESLKEITGAQKGETPSNAKGRRNSGFGASDTDKSELSIASKDGKSAEKLPVDYMPKETAAIVRNANMESKKTSAKNSAELISSGSQKNLKPGDLLSGQGSSAKLGNVYKQPVKAERKASHRLVTDVLSKPTEEEDEKRKSNHEIDWDLCCMCM